MAKAKAQKTTVARNTITHRVLMAFRKPSGVTEVSRRLKLPRSRVAARTLELEDRGLVKPTGRSDKGTGIPHLVYKMVAN